MNNISTLREKNPRMLNLITCSRAWADVAGRGWIREGIIQKKNLEFFSRFTFGTCMVEAILKQIYLYHKLRK